MAAVRGIVTPLVERKMVTYVPWPWKDNTEARRRYLEDCFNRDKYSNASKWLTSLEIDEYLVLNELRDSQGDDAG